MIEAELFDGTVLEFPEGTSPDVIQRVVKEQTQQRRQAAPVAPAAPQAAATPAPAVPEDGGIIDAIMGGLDSVASTGAYGLQEARRGFGSVLGLPVDAVNNAPRLLNMLPGVDGVGPISERPYMGSQYVNDALDVPAELFAAANDMPSELQPDNAVDRIVGRVGRELGATAVPFLGSVAATTRTTAQAARNAGPLTRMFVAPAATNPVGLAGREATYATGSGFGAGIANELADNPQVGDNFWSDFAGSLAGVTATAAGSGLVSAVRNTVAAGLNKPGLADDVAGQEVADRIINNSTAMGEQYSTTGRLDTQALADQLRRPSRIEQAVPGYRSNIGDRTNDPQLMTFAQNTDMLNPGASNLRRTANEAAIDTTIQQAAPNGDPAAFRSAIEASRDQRIAQAMSDEDLIRVMFEDASQTIEPSLREASARGSAIRGGVQSVYDREQQRVSDLYKPINEATVPVDVAPLRDQFREIDQNLPLNDRQRFRPTEANIPAQLAPEQPADPVPTGLVDQYGTPITRPPEQVDQRVPLREITATRSGLTDDIRAQRAAGQRQAARVGGQYKTAIDEFTDAAVPPELRNQLDTARAARTDVADRFERPGTLTGEMLATREGGGYAMDDSVVPRRATPDDRGRIDDFRSILREAGDNPQVRGAIADEVLADVQARGLINRPEQLRSYLDQRRVVLGEFPELRQRLEAAGSARTQLTAAERNTRDTTQRLTTPGRSAEASYLRFDNEATADAVRNLVNGPKPREATKQLLEAAGNSPEARVNARSAFWRVVQNKKLPAQGMTGNDRWDGKKLKAVFDDPKTAAVAEELWSDAPEELASIRELFDALASAEGSVRARQPGSSGTAQAIYGKLDPSLTATSLASRARSVNRNQMSPGIAVIDIATTWLRNRSKQVQSRAIDTLASAAVNNPQLAADLLERFNPADYAARRAFIAQKYGVRATQVLNLMDDMMAEEDNVMSAITEEN